MIYRRLEFSSWRPKLIVSEEQEPLKEFTTVSMGICEHNTPLQKTLDWLDPTTTHIDVDTYASLLQVCGSSNALSDGRHVHHHIMRHGHGAHMFLGFLILEMYGKCGAFEDAMAWFAEMPCRTVCVWNYMMGLYLRHGRSVSALRLFDQMLQEGMLADKITYINIISVCTSLTSLAEGKRINTRITGSGYESQVVVVTALVNLYGKCGDPNHARQLFDGMPRRDTITWNALISGYKHHRHGKEALQLFDQMQMEGVLPSRATFACTLSACASQVSLCQGKRMHVYIVQTGFESEFVISNALVRMYSQCGSLDDAQRLFDVLSNVNVVASNAMIAAYAQHGCLKEALKLLARMQHEGAIVDMISYISMLDVCGSQAALAEGKQMHACIKRSGYEREIIVGNALVSMYGRCQSLEDAQKVFDKMPDRDVVSWNAIISAYAQNRHGKEALQLFDHMQQAGMIPNRVTFICVLDAFTTQADLLDTKWFHTRVLLSGFASDVTVATTLVNMHGKTGSLVDAQNIFDLIPEPNVVSWTAMISAHSLLGHDKEALQLFDQMLQQGAIPDMVTFLNTIGACTSQAALNEGKIMHVLLKQCAFESELPIANALVNMYGKCGYLGAAWDVFDRLPVRNVATWNVMIATHAQHGLGKEALCLLEQMQQTGVVPDKVTFVTYLSACSRAGLVDEAFGFLHYRNVNDFLVAPALEHYDCIVDLLGRAGQSHEAEIMIDIMPFQPTALSWMTLLTACRNLLDVEQGESSAKHVVEIDPKDHVPYVMLANIYAAVGREEDAEMILSIMINKEVLLSKENHTCQGQYFEEEYQGSYGLLFGCS